MIYDALEQVYTVLNANFVTDFAALVAAKGVTGVVTTTGLEKRQDANTMIRLRATLPAIGIYAVAATTQAKDQAKRDSVTTVVCEYLALGSDPVALAKQAELAAEALCKSIDRVAASGAGVYGGGEARQSVEVVLNQAYTETVSPNYEQTATITFPVWDRDEGL